VPSIGKFLVMILYLAVALASLIYGLTNANIGLPSPPAPGQAFATVFVQDTAANPTLTAYIYTDEPWKDYLTVEAPKHAKWLVVMQCPSARPARHPIYLTTEAVPQAQAQAASSPAVTVQAGEGSSPRHVYPRCFSLRLPASQLRESKASPCLR
jgi:hypothetical protein